VPNPTPKEETEAEEWWDCPICMRPQAASEKEFNEHIDLCLSRQTIRDAVQETSEKEPAPVGKKIKLGNEKGRDKMGKTDPRQRRLCFG